MAEHLQNIASTAINQAAGISSTDLSFTVTNAAVFTATPNFRVIADSEIMLVTGVAGNVLTVTRGQEGTTATAHANGATVSNVLTAGALEQYVSENSGGGGGGGGFTNPMTTAGDIIVGGAAGAAGRLGIGLAGQLLTVSGGVPAWVSAGGSGLTPFNVDVNAAVVSSAFLAHWTDSTFPSWVQPAPLWSVGSTPIFVEVAFLQAGTFLVTVDAGTSNNIGKIAMYNTPTATSSSAPTAGHNNPINCYSPSADGLSKAELGSLVVPAAGTYKVWFMVFDQTYVTMKTLYFS